MIFRGQISNELLIIIGFMLLFLIPLLFYAHGRSNAASEDIAAQKAEAAAQRLASLADSVGYLGGAAAIVDEIEMPPNLRGITVNGQDIVITVDSSSGQRQIVKTCAFNLTESGLGRIRKAGTYFINVSALPPGEAAQVKLELS
ncbi:TPA: hypothetical protein HA225_05595 [Candidatus Micrarchaeota archaeon]|nr:hypothetical protein [Candidatus Micrarchaeota archaeon]